MSIQNIITVPDEMLRKVSEPIEKIGVNEKKLIKSLYDTMYNSKGIGDFKEGVSITRHWHNHIK